MQTIAIDAVGIGQPGGGRSATMSLLGALLRQDTSRHYLLLLDRPEAELALGEHVEQVLVPVHHRLLARLWAQATWPVLLRRRGVNLVHHIKNLTTPGLPGRRLVTIYDMTIVLYPELYPTSDVLYWRYVQPHLLRHMDRIVAISHQTADDMTLLYGLSRQKIQVIYPAYDPLYHPMPPDAIAQTRAKYRTGPHYLLHVGNISRKKNLLTLLLAFEQLCQRGYEGKLVLAGGQYTKGHDDAFYSHLAESPYRERVLLTSAVPLADLPGIYSAADAFVFPSLHEGFGIVPVEAMACGTPVISSGAGALAEVIGDAGIILPDIRDASALAEAIARVLADEGLRAGLTARGLERAKRYTASRAAQQTLALYDELLKDTPCNNA